MKVSTILDQVDMGSIALPEFQRGYVWNREQVRGLMDSLYRKHPVGSLLVWETLGKLNTLQVHHVFPKSLLYNSGYDRSEVNAIANFTFLTQATNLKVFNRDPAEYLPEYARKHPGAIESHWIPMDPELWKVENYPRFLKARRELLAQAANDFLSSLLAGAVPQVQVEGSVLERAAEIEEMVGEEENQLLREVNAWIVEQGLPEGEFDYELTDGQGEPLAAIDLAWPDGLQEGLSQPVALLIDAGHDVEQSVNDAGYRFFTRPEDLGEYVSREVLALSVAT